MRTKQELLEYIDRVTYVGVDKSEAQSQFAVIELPSDSGTQDENAGEHESTDRRGV